MVCSVLEIDPLFGPEATRYTDKQKSCSYFTAGYLLITITCFNVVDNESRKFIHDQKIDYFNTMASEKPA